MKFLGPLACKAKLSKKCEPAILKIMEMMSPGNFRDKVAITLVNGFKAMLVDPYLKQALPKVALKVMNRIDGHDSESSLWQDLVTSLEETGIDREQATEKAWSYLAFYGARGASVNIAQDMPDKENVATFVAAHIISAGMSVLDGQRLKNLQSYSFPKEIKYNCEFGKPYHFWAAAYLANHLVRLGHPRDAAFVATHMSGVGYAFASPTFGRSTKRTFREPQVEKPYNMMLRMGITFRDAGAFWGATEGLKGRRYNIGKALKRMIKRSKTQERLPEEKLTWDEDFKDTTKDYQMLFSNYLFWRKAISPNRNLWRDRVLLKRLSLGRGE